MDPSTLVAFKMNGAALPSLHGGPLRLVVPGWCGNHWMKWLRTITLSDEEAPGSFQRVDYRMPQTPVQPGEAAKPEETTPLTQLNVKSLITSPSPAGVVKPGELQISGVAWTGVARVARVDVAIDDGPWRPATFLGPDHPYAWRMWKFDWTATPGKHRVRARAADTEGAIQPEKLTWNPGGYLWNGIEDITLEVAQR